MLNPWANSRNQVNLTNTLNITANSIELIISDEEIVNSLELFLSYSNTSTAIYVQVPMGVGLF